MPDMQTLADVILASGPGDIPELEAAIRLHEQRLRVLRSMLAALKSEHGVERAEAAPADEPIADLKERVRAGRATQAEMSRRIRAIAAFLESRPGHQARAADIARACDVDPDQIYNTLPRHPWFQRVEVGIYRLSAEYPLGEAKRQMDVERAVNGKPSETLMES